jgi:hypothetical protein
MVGSVIKILVFTGGSPSKKIKIKHSQMGG